MIHLKVIKSKDYQVNICDEDLIGRKINNTTISESFYGERTSSDKALAELKKATLVNALGSEAVKLLKKVKGDLNTIKVNGVPHAQFFLIT
ncbi:DUF424 family protein [archaeon]|nr:DUF424 family protein [archaeon]